MFKLKAKFMSVLMAFCCVFACLGVATVLISNKATEAKAATYTEHNIGALELHVNSQPWGGAGNVSNQLYLQRADGEALPIQSWDYFFAKDSDVNFKINGKAAAFSEMKSTDAGLFFLFNALNVGEYITISGTFTCEAANAKYVIAESTFLWDSTGWSKCEVYEIGALELHVNSQPWGGAGNVSNQLYLQRADGGDLPVQTWDYLFTKGNDVSFKINGEAATFSEMKSTDAGIFFLFNALNAGERITISGTFICKDLAKAYAIEETSFIWTGTEWQLVVQYDTYTITELSMSSGDATTFYLYSTAGDALPSEKADWDNRYTLVEGETTLNGNPVDIQEVKMPGDLYVVLGFDVKVGDVLTFNGAFASDVTLVKLVFDNCRLEWNGSAWVEPYSVYTITELGMSSGDATTFYLYSTAGDAFPNEKADWDNRYTLVEGETTLNGNPVDIQEVKMPGDLYVVLGFEVKVGDVLTFNGTLASDVTLVKLVFDNCQLQWNGTAWIKYVPPVVYDTYTITGLGMASGDATTFYLYSTAGDDLPSEKADWDNRYTLVEGETTLNGNPVSIEEIKMPGDLYVVLGFDVEVGDVLTFNGAFASDVTLVKLVFDNCQLKWNGSAWETYVPTYYTTHNIGALVLHGNSITGGANGNNNELYLQRADGNALPITSWDVAFVAESEENFKINGEVAELLTCKSTGDGFYWKFNNLSAGDVVTISGTFICEAQNTKYVIEESEFQWNGGSWQKYVPVEQYTNHDLGQVVTISGDAAGVYLAFAEGVTLPVSSWDYAFNEITGNGITVDGTMVRNYNNIKSVGDKLYVELANVSEGSLLVVEGGFGNISQGHRYVIEESKFVWNGSAWEIYVPDYNATELGEVALYSTLTSNATSFYFTKSQNSLTSGARNKIFYPVLGTGVLINGNAVEDVSFKQTSTTHFTLTLSGVNVGDILTIGGTFATTGATIYAYEFIDTQFQWDGSAWAKYVPPVEEIPTYEVGKVLATRDSNASQVYLAKANGTAFEVKGDWTLTLTFEEGSGVGITFNGTQIAMNDIKIPNDIFVGLGRTASKGDKFVIEGAFFSEELNVKYIIEESTFYWSGAAWIEILYADSELATYDEVNLVDIGLGTAINIAGGSNVEHTDKYYISSLANTTGSVKFRFGYNSTDSNAGCIDIRLRGTAWEGVHFNISWSQIFYDGNSFTFSNNTDYVIELGAIDLLDGTGTWVYVSVDGVFVISKKVDLRATSFNTNRVSLYINEGVAKTTLYDVDHVAVTYTTSNGSFVEYARKNSTYEVTHGRTTKVFVGWVTGNKVYPAGAEYEIGNENVTFTALTLDFTMDYGAAIRLAKTSDESGIRFITRINEAELNALVGNYGITSISYGTLIMPFDYLEGSKVPNLSGEFEVGKDILKISSNYQEVKDGYVIYRGAMAKINAGNYNRLFAGRGYMEITLEGGDVFTIYTPFDVDNNVRSIRYIAQQYQGDTDSDYTALPTEIKTVVDTYADKGTIKLLNYEAYAQDLLNVTAWYQPNFDPSNAYNNTTNDELVTKMIEAGIKTVVLDGEYHLDLNTYLNIEKTRQLINYLWSKGLKTIAFGSNAGTACNIDFTVTDYPDFSDCEGFIGFLVWDEPSTEANITKLAELAVAFEKRYAGTGVTFMANLLPSYAEAFSDSEGWFDKEIVIDHESYSAYLQKYATEVLSKVSGEKWLSLDTYPIFADKSLHSTFLYDLAMLKYFALQNDAVSHAVLQSSGWEEGSHADKNRMPTVEEMRMQAYTAMAFGIDSISWWSYSDKRDDNQENPTDNDDYYNRFKTINTELNAISAVYSAFEWKGVILGKGKDNGSIFSQDQDYNAFNNVNGKIGAYELTVGNTKHLSSVATNKTNWNYLMGVMEDMSGNEGYVLCNYNSHEEDRAMVITVTFNKNITEVVIYRGGVKTTQSVSGQTLTINLATGEGIIVIPSKLG